MKQVLPRDYRDDRIWRDIAQVDIISGQMKVYANIQDGSADYVAYYDGHDARGGELVSVQSGVHFMTEKFDMVKVLAHLAQCIENLDAEECARESRVVRFTAKVKK